MSNCVVTLSGYRDCEADGLNIATVGEGVERYGRRELKQAIRLSGACYSGPLLRFDPHFSLLSFVAVLSLISYVLLQLGKSTYTRFPLSR